VPDLFGDLKQLTASPFTLVLIPIVSPHKTSIELKVGLGKKAFPLYRKSVVLQTAVHTIVKQGEVAKGCFGSFSAEYGGHSARQWLVRKSSQQRIINLRILRRRAVWK
jgi:hypothetical protein